MVTNNEALMVLATMSTREANIIRIKKSTSSKILNVICDYMRDDSLIKRESEKL